MSSGSKNLFDYASLFFDRMTTLTRQRRVLLVDGYIRQQEKTLNLSQIIPFSINSIIFEFQMFVEKWSKKWSNSKVNIIDDGNIAEVKHGEKLTLYGEYIVKYGGNFMWTLEIIQGKNIAFWLGLIRNKEDLLKQYKSSFNWYYGGGYLWEAGSGFFGFDDGKAASYSGQRSIFKFRNKGDKAKIKFSWMENSLHYIVNGVDFGNALKIGKCMELTTDENAEFRLAVCLRGQIELDTTIQIKVDGESF